MYQIYGSKAINSKMVPRKQQDINNREGLIVKPLDVLVFTPAWLHFLHHVFDGFTIKPKLSRMSAAFLV